jgi:hypothetical protein
MAFNIQDTAMNISANASDNSAVYLTYCKKLSLLFTVLCKNVSIFVFPLTVTRTSLSVIRRDKELQFYSHLNYKIDVRSVTGLGI